MNKLLLLIAITTLVLGNTVTQVNKEECAQKCEHCCVEKTNVTTGNLEKVCGASDECENLALWIRIVAGGLTLIAIGLIAFCIIRKCKTGKSNQQVYRGQKIKTKRRRGSCSEENEDDGPEEAADEGGDDGGDGGGDGGD